MRLRTQLVLTILPFMLVGTVVAAVLVVTGTSGDATRPSAAVSTYPAVTPGVPPEAPGTGAALEPATNARDVSDAQLHQDYNMTQYMSLPNATGPMFTGGAPDPQLEHSTDPAFVRRLEAHQREVDRMLGKYAP